MRNLIKECAPWLNWKVGAVFAAALLSISFIVGMEAGLLALAGATPFIAIAACLVPCLIPLALLRKKKTPPNGIAPATGGCSCGSDACTIDASANSCRSQISLVAEKRQ